MIRHPPECFENGRHKLWPYDAEHCPKQGQIFHGALGWINNPFDDCNLSEHDWWCYTHKSWDCSRLDFIWRAAVQIDQRCLTANADLDALLACAINNTQSDWIRWLRLHPDELPHGTVR